MIASFRLLPEIPLMAWLYLFAFMAALWLIFEAD